MNTAIHSRCLRPWVLQGLAAATVAICAPQARAETAVILCAEAYTQTLPGASVPMWGYRQVADEASCNAPLSPRDSSASPVLRVPAGESTLKLTLVNRLNVPTSVVIASQSLPVDGGAPVMASDVADPAAVCTPQASATGSGTPNDPLVCRVRSFTGETLPGSTRTYTFANLRAGTYLYQSGTHPQVQVQMGLFGMLAKDGQVASTAGRFTYANDASSAFDADISVVLSEVDDALHGTIQGTLGTAGQQGLWKSESHTVLDYVPRFFLVNGKPFTSPESTVLATAAHGGSRVLLRVANAGLRTRSLVVNDGHWMVLGEDGYAYASPREQFNALVPAGKTMDASFVNAGSSSQPLTLFDRRGGTDNADGGAWGGQVASVAVTEGNLPPSVNAGADEKVASSGTVSAASPVTVQLSGFYKDDGQPNATPTVTWSVVSGSATVSGTTVSGTTSGTASATATFPANGIYVLRLTADDGSSTSSDDKVVCVNPALSVSAGPSRTVKVASVPVTALSLQGSATEPCAASLTTTWSVVSAPAGGVATFANPTQLATSASFSIAGDYTLRLSASDGTVSASSDVTISIANTAPTVNAGADAFVAAATTADAQFALAGVVNDTASDAGVTVQPTALKWTVVSVPSTGAGVVFANDTLASTTATFSAYGVYKLRLTANDGQFTVFDDIVVAVRHPAVAADSFDRANASTLGTDWSQPTTAPAISVSGNVAANPASAATAVRQAMWSANVNASQWAEFRIASATTATSGPALILKATGTTGNASPATYVRVRFTTAGVTADVWNTAVAAQSLQGSFALNDRVTASARAVTAGTTRNVIVDVWKNGSHMGQMTLPNLPSNAVPNGVRIGILLPPGGQIDDFAAGVQ